MITDCISQCVIGMAHWHIIFVTSHWKNSKSSNADDICYLVNHKSNQRKWSNGDVWRLSIPEIKISHFSKYVGSTHYIITTLRAFSIQRKSSFGWFFKIKLFGKFLRLERYGILFSFNLIYVPIEILRGFRFEDAVILRSSTSW